MVSKVQTVVDAFAEWDDPDAFRVYLQWEGEDDPRPMRREFSGPSLDARLFRAAFAANPLDFTNDIRDHLVGFEKEAAAKRAAKAVKKELTRIAKGEPALTDHAVSMSAQIAQVMKKGKRR